MSRLMQQWRLAIGRRVCHRHPAVGGWQVNVNLSQNSSVSNGVKNTETSRIFSIKTKRDI